MQTKKCNKCHTDKDASQFSPLKGGKYGLSSWCKSCHRDYQRQRRQARATDVRNIPALTVAPLRSASALAIRPDRLVIVSNIPADLTRAEANRIGRILMALADDDPTGGERL